MPGLNGFELIEIIRCDPELEDIRTMDIIVHTSWDLNREDETRLTLNGKMGSVTKTKAADDIASIVSNFYSEN